MRYIDYFCHCGRGGTLSARREVTIAFDGNIKEYLKEINESPLLTWEEEQQLSRRIIKDNDPQAREHMVRSNLRLVVNIAKKYAGRKMGLADLIEEGNLGLLKAVDCFDPDHGVRFSTYAAWWIKQSIKRALLMNSQPIHIPTYMVELMHQWRYLASQLESKLGAPPTLQQMAKEMHLSLRKARAIRENTRTVTTAFRGNSLDEDNNLSDTISDRKSIAPEQVMLGDEEKQHVLILLNELEPRESQVLVLRFGLEDQAPLTLKEIGKRLNLTRERVRQIQRNALEKLYQYMSDD